MATTSAPNHRASLLAGLRTGGVRSTSATVPHTAAPGGTFQVPRFVSHSHPSSYSDDEDEDQLAEMPQQNVYLNPHQHHSAQRAPMTAAVDGPSFSQQMSQRGMNPNSIPFSPAYQQNVMTPPNTMQNQAFQMQMLQLEMLRIQNIQAQQMQAELIAQAQRQQQQAQQAQMHARERRISQGFNPPATAGPTTNSFDLRAAALVRRANQAEQVKFQLGVTSDEQVPMTAALGGKFGSRTMSLNAPATMPRFADEYDDGPLPSTPSSTTVISGGTSLGNLASNNINSATGAMQSKSDSATSWRRGGNNNSVLSGNNRVVSSPSVKITPPPNENQRVSPPPASNSQGKSRPMPLRFSAAISQPLPIVTIDSSDSNDNDDGSSSSSVASHSSPTTPRSSSSSDTPLSPREEASKKLYEGLGIGRPVQAVLDAQQQPLNPTANYRVVSQPLRQPRGPPSGADELGPKNFATRIRRKAIGGLGMLMGARERREIVEVY